MPQAAHPVRPEDIHPLSDFLRNHKAHLDRLEASGRPELLTVNGAARVVVIEAGAYHRLYELADRMETIESVREALEESRRGETVDLEVFDREFRSRHGIHDPSDSARPERSR